jgi:uncharacterized tellurite resistance protein B-like protein
MEVRELTQDERRVLFGLLAHLADADGRTSAGELEELEALGEEMGTGSLQSALVEARAIFATPQQALEAASGVTRSDARELIRTLLHDLAGSDGERSAAEVQLLTDLGSMWPR